MTYVIPGEDSIVPYGGATTAIPEPKTLLLLGFGLVFLAAKKPVLKKL